MKSFKDYVKDYNDKHNRSYTIGVNIWDDYVDDGYGKQKTHMYVEESDLIDTVEGGDIIAGEVMKMVFDYMKANLNFDGVKYDYSEGDDRFNLEDLTHKRLDEWMSVLGNVKFEYKGIPVKVYSES